jgi:hypothetical protein
VPGTKLGTFMHDLINLHDPMKKAHLFSKTVTEGSRNLPNLTQLGRSLHPEKNPSISIISFLCLPQVQREILPL